MSVTDKPATRLWREALAQLEWLLEKPPGERAQRLADIGRTQPQLHSMLVSLLDADERANRTGFLDAPRLGHALAPGSQLGPYRIESRIGAGGMGEVWLASRVDGLYQGQVAIKTLHPYFGGGALRDRFLREALILGRLQHPGIARLLDAGVAPDGSVYLVLEFVRGSNLDAWCDEQRLGVDARRELRIGTDPVQRALETVRQSALDRHIGVVALEPDRLEAAGKQWIRGRLGHRSAPVPKSGRRS